MTPNFLTILNWVTMIIVSLILIGVVIWDRRLLGVPWISLIFFLLLLSILFRRADDLGALFGIDVISPTASLILSWLVIGVLAWGKWQVHRNARIIRMMSQVHVDKILELEEMRYRDEKKIGYSWDHIHRA